MILAQAQSSDLLVVVSAVLVVVLGGLGGLLLWVLSGIRQDMGESDDRQIKSRDELAAAIKENSRHIQGVLANQGPLMWRLISVEDWLEKHPGEPYSPPRDMGWTDKHS